MASAAKPARKKFRVAVSGATVDGREIRPEHLRDAAANYSPDVYGARVNVEHYLSPFPGSDFGAMGDVTALSAEDISEGPLAGRTALYAEIEPSERMKKLTEEGKKIYSSIELHPQFALNGKAYVMGLAMTDTPASLGTERLKFAAQQRQQVMSFNNQQGKPHCSPTQLRLKLSNWLSSAAMKASSGSGASWGSSAKAVNLTVNSSARCVTPWRTSPNPMPICWTASTP